MQSLLSHLDLAIYRCKRQVLPAGASFETAGDPEVRLYAIYSANKMELTVAGESMEVGSGHIAMVPARTAMRWVCAKDVDIDWLHCSAELLPGIFLHDLFPCPLIMPIPDSLDVRRLYNTVGEHFENPATGAQFLAAAALLQLLALFYPSSVSFEGYHSRGLRRFLPVLHYIQQHLDAPLPVSELASQAHLEVSYFIRLFEKTIGISPKQYVLRQKIQAACRLLTDSDLSLGQVAEKMAFVDQFHFSRVFKKYMKQTPSAFRSRRSGGLMP